MNNVLPARMGELVRAHLGGRATKQSRAYVLATIAAERLADGLTISFLFVVFFIFGASTAELERGRLMFVVACFFAIAGLLTVLMLLRRNQIFTLLGRLGEVMPGHLSGYTLERIQRFIEGLEPLLHPRKVFILVSMSLAVWSIELIAIRFVTAAFEQPMSLGGLVLFLAAVNFSSLVPSGPAAAGVIEGIASPILQTIGIRPEIALAMVATHHFLQFVVVGVPGASIFLFGMRGRLPKEDLEEEFDSPAESFVDVSGAEANPASAQVDTEIDIESSAELDLSIVVPAYNEEDRLPKSLLTTLDYFKQRSDLSWEIIVVDDGSQDNTSAVVEQMKGLSPNLRLLENGVNRGKGFSVRSGILDARGALILFADADGATPIEELRRLEEAIAAGADVAIGSRALYSRDTSVDAIWYRKFLGRIFNAAVNILILPGVADSQCGFKLFRRKAALEIFSRQKAERFSFDVEVLFLARKSSYRIAEVPINWNNIPGSKVNLLKDSIAMLIDIIKFRLRDLAGGYDK